MDFSKEELIHYSRHLAMPEFGESAQLKLKKSSVLLVGLGGLGSPALLYLAAAGVGRIGIVDFDRVDASNLQRQILYNYDDLGKSKALQAQAKAKALNPHIQIQSFEATFEIANAKELVKNFDLIIDGADNFSTRYLVNDVCGLLKKPLVSASVLEFEGQLYVFHLKDGPCYRCLYPEPPPEGTVPSCSEAGVLGVLPGMMGILQATEAIKILSGVGAVKPNEMKVFDALNLSMTDFRIRRDKNCPLCGDNPMITELKQENFVCRTDLKTSQAKPKPMSPLDLKAKLADQNLCLVDVREQYERDIVLLTPSLHFPLQEILECTSEQLKAKLDPKKTYVMQCRSGVRSAKAAKKLAESGFEQVFNLSGGILAWIDQVDPSLKKY